MKAKASDLEAFARAEELQAALHRAQRQLAEERRRKDDLAAAVYRAAKDAALGQSRADRIPTPHKGKPGDHWALLHLTDWQLGKRTVDYGREVCERRVRQAVEAALRLVELQRHAYRVTSCAVLLGGDMLEGVSIFPGQAWEVDGALYEQLFACAALIEQAVASLLAEFARVEVWCEWGNHGRLGRKGDMRPSDNADRMAYRIARDQLLRRGAVGERLVWHESEDFYQHGEIGAYRFLLVHGDEIKSFGGNVPAFGIVRKATGWRSGVLPEFRDVYMGHWHQHQQLALPNGGAIYVTGSPESSNAYAKEFCAASGQPSQRLHFVDPVKGRVVSECRLWLD